MNLYRDLLVRHPAIPWRIRSRLERWVETRGRLRYASLYRWLHFGRTADVVHPITRGPHHHFFGYYDKTPWNASRTFILAHEATFNDRPPRVDDRVAVGFVRPDGSGEFEGLADTCAWNWQQGTMLQWHPRDPEHLFLHNDRRDGCFVAVVRDLSGAEQEVIRRPIYAILPDGRTAFSLNFSRLARYRPGYGYEGGVDLFAEDPAPDGDGIWRVDLDSDRDELIVSTAQLASHDPAPSMAGAFHYVNHIQASRGGERIAFFHIWCTTPREWQVRLYTCRPDGSALSCLLDSGTISHYDWLGDEAILVWALPPEGGRAAFLRISLDGEVVPFAASSVKVDGHCSFSPDRRWVLNDTYPDAFGMRTLMVLSWPEGRRVDLARLYSPKERWWGEIRCDLHPRWSRDGRSICLDSVHDGTRQIYAIDLAEVGL